MLEWEHRLPLVLQELQEADADIICLQEVNRMADLQLPGYSLTYLRKNCEDTRCGTGTEMPSHALLVELAAPSRCFEF